MKKSTFGIYENVTNINETLKSLAKLNYTDSEVSIVTREDTIGKVRVENDASEGLQSGAKTGGLVGGVLGLLAGIGVLTLPGVGAIFITGPLIAALGLSGIVGATATGALTGAIAGGLVAGLKEIGIDEMVARDYEKEIQKGNMLLCIFHHNEENVDKVEEILKKIMLGKYIL